MASDDSVGIINQNRIAEPEPSKTFGDLTDLFACVGPRIGFMRYKLVHGYEFDLVIGAVKEAPLHRISAARAGALLAQPTSQILIVFTFHLAHPNLAAGTIPAD
jgi:hypothetical protein